MTLTNAVKQRIINLATSNELSMHRLAINSGLAYSTLSSFLNGKCESLTLTTLLHICEGSRITLKDFFDDKLFDNVVIDADEDMYMETR